MHRWSSDSSDFNAPSGADADDFDDGPAPDATGAAAAEDVRRAPALRAGVRLLILDALLHPAVKDFWEYLLFDSPYAGKEFLTSYFKSGTAAWDGAYVPGPFDLVIASSMVRYHKNSGEAHGGFDPIGGASDPWVDGATVVKVTTPSEKYRLVATRAAYRALPTFTLLFTQNLQQNKLSASEDPRIRGRNRDPKKYRAVFSDALRADAKAVQNALASVRHGTLPSAEELGAAAVAYGNFVEALFATAGFAPTRKHRAALDAAKKIATSARPLGSPSAQLIELGPLADPGAVLQAGEQVAHLLLWACFRQELFRAPYARDAGNFRGTTVEVWVTAAEREFLNFVDALDHPRTSTIKVLASLQNHAKGAQLGDRFDLDQAGTDMAGGKGAVITRAQILQLAEGMGALLGNLGVRASGSCLRFLQEELCDFWAHTQAMREEREAALEAARVAAEKAAREAAVLVAAREATRAVSDALEAVATAASSKTDKKKVRQVRSAPDVATAWRACCPAVAAAILLAEEGKATEGCPVAPELLDAVRAVLAVQRQ